MKHIFIIILLLISTPALADSSEIMLKMINFIVERTDLEYNGEPLPGIEIKSPQQLCEGAYPPAVLAEMKTCSIAGYYNNDTSVIFISNVPVGKMVSNGFFEVVLVHELVHYLHFLNDIHLQVKCKNQLEVDAYRIQREYIEYMSLPSEQKPDPFFALLISMCPDDFLF